VAAGVGAKVVVFVSSSPVVFKVLVVIENEEEAGWSSRRGIDVEVGSAAEISLVVCL